jgi:TetR/AcrR family transcriptional regulator, transcriptional repressor for nem operon
MGIADSKNVRQSILDVAQRLVGNKGFSAVGLNEVLQTAQVPKGSFYHYFESKDAFGVALLDEYFEGYLHDIQLIFNHPDLSENQKLGLYWQRWIDNQTRGTDSGKCLAVKLGAEVADLSEPMRLALNRGTASVIEYLAVAMARGVEEGSLRLDQDPEHTALRLYSLWLGASVMAKITRTTAPFDEALLMTYQVLGVEG